MKKHSSLSIPPPLVPEATDDDLRRRRDAAFALAQAGCSENAVAKSLNVSQPTVHRWLNGTQRAGAVGSAAAAPRMPRPKPRDGRPPLLTDGQLRALLAVQPGMSGSKFRNAVSDAFGITYSLSHCCALLKYLREGATRFAANRRNRPARS